MAALRKLRWTFIIVPLLVVLTFLIVYPVLTLVLGSFRLEPPRGFNLSLEGLTLANYIRVFSHVRNYQALKNTVIAAGLGTLFSVITGSWLAWLTARTNVPFKRLIGLSAIMPLFLSSMVGALAWITLASPNSGLINLLFRDLGLPFRVNIQSMGGVIFIFTLYYTPYVYMFVNSALSLMDPSLEEAARISGASTFRTMQRVTLPLVLPSILASAILVFVFMMEVFAVPSLLAEPAQIPFLASSLYRYLGTVPPDINQASALGMLLLVITTGLVSFQHYVVSRRSYVTVAGKGLKQQIIDLGPFRWPAAFSGLLYIVVAAVLPFFAILINGFRSHMFIPHITRIFENMGTRHLDFVMSYAPARTAIINSLWMGLATALVGGVLYFVVAYVIYRTNLPGRRVLDWISMLPVAIPGLVLGIAYLWAWISLPIGLYGTVWIMVLAYVARLSPQGVRASGTTLVQIHTELEESARICGASPVKTMWRVIVPLAKPGLASSMILLFITSVRELSTSIFLYTPKSVVLSVIMYDMWENGMFGGVSLLALVQTTLLLGVIVVAQRVFGISVRS